MLTALKIKNAKPNDGKRLRLGDGDNLWLFVDKNGNKSWVFRYVSPATGKEREMGLGPERDLTLAQARDAAQAARALLRDRIDPKDHRDGKRTAAKVEESRSITFQAYAERFISMREAGWKNPIHRQQWRNSLRDHVFPAIGHLSVADVDTEAVLRALRPIWNELPETARRVRGRIEAVLSAAKAEKFRTGENPALWRGHLDQLLSRRRKSDVVHHAALPYAEMPEFMACLASDTSNAARMLRFVIQTACRFSEAAGMQGAEVSNGLWTVPGSRMKGGRKHVVPLTQSAMACLPFEPVSDVSLANAIRRHTNSPATTHGMRSTFRDWAGDCTDYPREVCEAALAHAIGNEVEASYRRGTALEKRRELMTEWSRFLHGDAL